MQAGCYRFVTVLSFFEISRQRSIFTGESDLACFFLLREIECFLLIQDLLSR